MSFSTTLQAGKSEIVTFLPEDSNGQAGTITADPPVWSSADPSTVSVVPAGDGLTGTIHGVKAGAVVVTVSATSTFANGSVSNSFTVTVTEGAATQAAFSFGLPF